MQECLLRAHIARKTAKAFVEYYNATGSNDFDYYYIKGRYVALKELCIKLDINWRVLLVFTHDNIYVMETPDDLR